MVVEVTLLRCAQGYIKQCTTAGLAPPLRDVRLGAAGGGGGNLVVVDGAQHDGVEGDVLGEPARVLLLPQPPPDGVLEQLLMRRDLVLLQQQSATFEQK